MSNYFVSVDDDVKKYMPKLWNKNSLLIEMLRKNLFIFASGKARTIKQPCKYIN